MIKATERTPEQILQKICSAGLAKESGRISWDDKWLGQAYLTSMRSIDARTKCGCVLVKDNQIVSEGFNGFIRGIDDGALPNYEGHKDPLLSKYT
jgi:dCMP deaminase